MSERDVVTPGARASVSTATSVREKIAEAARKEQEAKKTKADEAYEKYGIPALDEGRLASVLARSQALDHLEFELNDDNLHGEWVRNDELEIHRKETLGFVSATQDMAKTRFSHNDGSGNVILGDCRLMVTTKRNMEIIGRVREQQYRAAHNPTKKKVKEEKEFDAVVDSTTEGIIPTFSDGSLENVDALRLEQALNNNL